MIKTMLHKLFLSLFASLLAVSFHVQANENPRVQMKTSMGEIELVLYPEKAPKSVANFLQYVRDKHYDGTIFHRVIDGFMIQGGGFDKTMHQKPTRTAIENEAANGLKNEPYTIAMARTSDPHSATAQFFINVAHNRFLDYPGQDGWGYAVFGKVVNGTDVVDNIKRTQTNERDVPEKPIMIESFILLK